jgi:hypothetical protein
MAISSTAITVTITVKGYAAADAPMAGFDKNALKKVVIDYIHSHFPTRTPHLTSNSNSSNQYPDTNEVHSAVSATPDLAAQPAGDLTTEQVEPVTVTVSLA